MTKESGPPIKKAWRQLFDKIAEPSEQLQSAVFGLSTGWHLFLSSIFPWAGVSFRRLALLTDRNVYLCRPGANNKSITVIAKYPLDKINVEARGHALIVGDKQFLFRPLNGREKKRLAQTVAIANN
jgi:hypothetical protein